MTDDLTTLLHRSADAGEFSAPDLDAILATGERRVRRRRTAAAGVVAAAAVALVVTAAVVLPGPEQTAPQPADDFPVVTDRGFEPMTTVGPRVFVGDETVRLDGWVDQLARTQDGFVYTGDLGLSSWVDGQERVVDETSGLLASDEDGHLVAWDTDDGGIDVLDQRTGEVGSLDLPDGLGRQLFPAAIDGSHVYLQGRFAAYRVDLGPDLETEAVSTVEGFSYVADVESGVIAGNPDESEGPVDLTRIASPDGTVVTNDTGDVGTLSPDGAWYAVDDVTGYGGGAGVIDTRTGRKVRLDHDLPERYTLDPSAWIDDDTVVVAVIGGFAGTPDQPLLTCSVPDGDCTIAIDDLRELPGRSGMGRTFPGGG